MTSLTGRSTPSPTWANRSDTPVFARKALPHGGATRAYARPIVDRAFPVVFAAHVTRTAAFYEELGFERHFQLPAAGDPGYVGLRRGECEIAVVADEWPEKQYGLAAGKGPRFEMFVYVDDVDVTVERLRAAAMRVLREPASMPWGERVAYLCDPDGNPVALAMPPKESPSV